MQHVYMPVSDYPEAVLGYYEGMIVDEAAVVNYLRHDGGESVRAERKPCSFLKTMPGIRLVLENITDYCKLFFTRKGVRDILDHLHPNDQLIVPSVLWLGTNAQDFCKIVTYFSEQQVSLIVVDFDEGKHQEITPSKHKPDYPEFSCIDMLKTVAQVELGRRNHLVNQSRVTKHKSIIYRDALSAQQLGFTISSHGKLLPHWGSQLAIRLIAYLRDEKDMSWGDLAKHLDYL